MAHDHEHYDSWEDQPTRRFEQVARARVLVADDDPELRTMMANRLRADGCDVIEAEDGHDAIDQLDALSDNGARQDQLDLVVMDVRMPGFSGIEVTLLMRSWRWATPVVLVTAYPEPELLDEAKRLGARVLAKPFGFSKLSAEARAALHGRTP
jgi:CheY-like chemotaxis protein